MKTSLPLRFLIGICLFLLFSCEKEINYPELKTEPLIALSNSSFVASAKVISRGDFKIIDHGFIYYLSSQTPDLGGFPTNNKISLGNQIENDTFAVAFSPEEINYYYDNMKCYVKAFITDERGTIYANYVYEPILQLRVLGVSPQVARIGDTISITGANFTAEPAANSVKFGNISALIVSAASNELKVVVPEGVVSYYWDNSVPINIISGGQSYNLSNSFQLAPSAIGFQPKSGSWGDVISISGSGFQNCTVFFDDVHIGSYSTSNSYINVYIPYELLYKKFKIYIVSGGIKFEVPGGSFTMDDLTIFAPNNLKYFPGSTITFSGNGFNPNTYRNKLYLEQNTIDAFESYSQLSFTLPGALPSGNYSLMISNSVDTVTLSEEIEIVRPVLSGISVNSGYPGSEVIVTGTNLTLANNSPSISFEPYNFSPATLSSTQIKFKVPQVPSGEYAISAYYGAFSLPFPWIFTVLEPTITSIEPTSGNTGMSVVIHGIGFHSLGYTRVYFGNVQAVIMSGTNAYLNVKVPSGLSSGVWTVQVYIDSSKLSTSAFFTVP